MERGLMHNNRMQKRFALVLLFMLGSCGGTQPFVDMRREAGTMETEGKSTPDEPVICYNSWSTTPAKVARLATDECARTGRKAEFIAQEKWSCRVFIPHRALYRCVPR